MNGLPCCVGLIAPILIINTSCDILPHSFFVNTARGLFMPTIRVEFFEGRTDDQKRAYAKALTDTTVDVLGCSPAAVDVIFYDIKKTDWATGGVLHSDQ